MSCNSPTPLRPDMIHPRSSLDRGMMVCGLHDGFLARTWPCPDEGRRAWIAAAGRRRKWPITSCFESLRELSWHRHTHVLCQATIQLCTKPPVAGLRDAFAGSRCPSWGWRRRRKWMSTHDGRRRAGDEKELPSAREQVMNGRVDLGLGEC